MGSIQVGLEVEKITMRFRRCRANPQSDTSKRLGTKIKKLRIKLGFSQKTLGVKLGYLTPDSAKVAISRLETGKFVIIPLFFVEEIAKELGVTPISLMKDVWDG